MKFIKKYIGAAVLAAKTVAWAIRHPRYAEFKLPLSTVRELCARAFVVAMLAIGVAGYSLSAKAQSNGTNSFSDLPTNAPVQTMTWNGITIPVVTNQVITVNGENLFITANQGGGYTVTVIGGQTPASANPTNGMPPLPTPQQAAATILANIPTVALTNETLGIANGVLMRDDSTFADATLIDWSVSTMFFLRGEIDTGTSGAGIEGTGLGGGIYKNLGPTRVWGVVEGRRNFTADSAIATPGQKGASWDALVGFGGAWAPTTNGVLANFSVGLEDRLVEPISKNANSSAPHNELVSEIRYSF